MRLFRQTPEWFDRLATLQEGYYYPWRSTLRPLHGEDAYVELVRQHVDSNTDVLDIACGHGEHSLQIAPQARSVLGYDRTAAWVTLAQGHARERGITNARFVCHDSSPAANSGRARLPAEDESFDVLICSKGPLHCIDDARRVARPGAILLMLVPDVVPLTPWHGLLPESLRWQGVPDPDRTRPAIEQRLAAGRLMLHSWWSFDVPEVFPDPEQLYAWRAWGYIADEVPSFEEVGPLFERIFVEYGDSAGVAIRHRCYLWKAVVAD
jgi:SAM-dependent methyltransferase